ncbi:MAG TPA: PPOX class F420-dependent oxidoreductase [Gemmatimonadales bacterium]|nr:PPOX class F420-dependent oxidoreductase [Gemmatimonadales bacterium]
MIPDSIRALVSTGPLAHLTTLNSNGSPQVTVVWVGIEGDEFVTAHLSEHRKIKNIRNDRRVALSFLGKGRNPQGLLEYVVAYGDARVTEGGAVDLLARLAQIYIGPKADFPPPPLRSRPGFVTRIRPDRFGGVGPWVKA